MFTASVGMLTVCIEKHQLHTSTAMELFEILGM